MRAADRSGFLTTSLIINFALVFILMLQWSTGATIIPLRPLSLPLLTLLPYGAALAVIYVGLVGWLYLLLVFIGDRWPPSKSLINWLTPAFISKRFLLIYSLTAFLVASLAVPYVSSRAHFVRDIVMELGFAGQGLALFGTVASIYGFLALLVEKDNTDE